MDVFKTLILDTPDSLDNISGVLPVVNGGTGADNAPDARVNLLPDYTGNANKVLSLNGTATDVEWTSNGAGDVAGPASSTDNAVARFDSTTGKVIQNSGVTISDANLLTADALSINNNTTLGSSNSDTVTFNGRIASEFTPATDNTYDLGRTGHEWRNLYLDGTANIDSLVADTADINGGTIDGTTIGATTPAAGTFSQVNSTGSIIATGSGSFGDDTDITGDLTVTGSLSATRGSAGVVATLLSGNSAQAPYVSLGRASEDSRITIAAANDDGLSGTVAGDLAVGSNSKIWLGTAGTGRVKIDSTGLAVTGAGSFTGNVGIGTTSSVGAKLNIGTTNTRIELGEASATTAYMEVLNAARDASIAFQSYALTHSLMTNSGAGWVSRLHINNSGNVGVGTTAPIDKLHVYENQATIGATQLTLEGAQGGYGAGVSFAADLRTSGAFAEMARITADGEDSWDSSVSTSQDAGLRFYTSLNGTVSEKVRINSAGNVGIGTSPSTPLHISKTTDGGIRTTVGSDSGRSTVNYSDGVYGNRLNSSSNYVINTVTADLYLQNDYSGNVYMVTGGGNVGIGTTVPTEKLTVSGSVSATGEVTTSSVFRASGGATDGRFDASFAGSVSGLSLTSSDNASAAYFAVFRKSDNTPIGTIRRVTTTDAVAYNTTSDGRLKENLRDFTDSGRLIDSLKPRVFDWKNSDENGKNVIGFIAQEEHAADPIFAHIGAVSVGDEDPETITKQWQRSDSALIPILVAELKSLRARVAALESN